MVFMFVTFAWLLFKLPEFNHVINLAATLIDNAHMNLNIPIAFLTLVYSLPVIFYHLIYLYKNRFSFLNISRFDPIIYGFLILMIITNSGSANKFIYFQF